MWFAVEIWSAFVEFLDSTARDRDAESLADISKRKPIVGYQNVKFPPSAADLAGNNFCGCRALCSCICSCICIRLPAAASRLLLLPPPATTTKSACCCCYCFRGGCRAFKDKHCGDTRSLLSAVKLMAGKRRLDDACQRSSKRLRPDDPPAFAGVDVGGVRKGFHLAVLRGKTIVSIERLADASLVCRRCLETNAAAVAVDAPCGWSSSGRSREAERAMSRHGIRAYSVPAKTLARLDGFHAWMLQGEAAYAALQPHFPLWTAPAGPSEPPFCFETFPHAITCALLGRIVRGADKSSDRRAVLKLAGIQLPQRTLSQDDVDACLCALAAQLAASGDALVFGAKDEGFIVIPRFRGALSQGL
jgi:predicted nuclease with RNAse H fold